MKRDTLFTNSESKSEIDSKIIETNLAEEEYNPTGTVYVFLMYAGIGVISTAIGIGLLLFVYTVVEITLSLITGQPIK